MIIAVKVIARIEKILASLVIDLMQRPVAVHIEHQGKNALIPPAVKPPAKFRQFSLLATRINENLVGIGKNNPVAIAILIHKRIEPVQTGAGGRVRSNRVKNAAVRLRQQELCRSVL